MMGRLIREQYRDCRTSGNVGIRNQDRDVSTTSTENPNKINKNKVCGFPHRSFSRVLFPGVLRRWPPSSSGPVNIESHP